MDFKNFNLTEKIDGYLLERRAKDILERQEKYGKVRDKFFASDSGSCKRKIAYEFYGLPKKTIDARTIRILENGNFLQSRYSKYFKDLGVWVNEELPFNTMDREDVPFFLAGRTDIIINYKKLFPEFFGEYTKEKEEINDLAIVEMKSINTWGFKGKDGVGEAGQAKLDHLYQLMLCMWLTGIHQGWIVYEDKNEQDTVAIPVVYDERILFGSGDERSKGIVNELEELAEQIEQKIIPPRTPEANVNKFPCKWKRGHCDFYDHCWNPEHNGEIIPIIETGVEIDGEWFDPENITMEDLKKLKEKITEKHEATEEKPKIKKKEELDLCPDCEIKDEIKETIKETKFILTKKDIPDKNIISGIFDCDCGKRFEFNKVRKDGRISCRDCGKTHLIHPLPEGKATTICPDCEIEVDYKKPRKPNTKKIKCKLCKTEITV